MFLSRVPEPQILLSFAPRQTFLELQSETPLDKCTKWPPKDPEHDKIKVRRIIPKWCWSLKDQMKKLQTANSC